MNILFIAYDNEHFTSILPQNLAALSAVLIKNNYNVEIYNQDIHHYDEEHLKKYLNENEFDFVGLGIVAGSYQYKKMLKISKAINESKNRNKFIYVLGGHGPSPVSEFYIKKSGADIVVIGEGEETIIELLESLKGKKQLENVKGIAFVKNGKCIKTMERELIEDIDSLPIPAYQLFPIEIYRMVRFPRMDHTDFGMVMLSGRGCKFKCNYCMRLDKGIRIRSNERIVEEIEFLKSKYNINYIHFSDELLMCSKERTISFSEYIIKSKLNIKWSCNGRLNYAKDDVLKIMKESGCVFVIYGVESYNNDMLKVMKKALTIKIINEGIENTLKYDITPSIGIMFGNIGETKQHLQNSVDFIKKYEKMQFRTIRPLTPYPGSPLYDYAIKNGYLKDIEDFYDNKCNNSDLLSVNFTNLTNKEFYEALYDANMQLIEDYYKKRKIQSEEECDNLYHNLNNDFKGFRRY